MCAVQVGHRNDNNDCPAKVTVVSWEEAEEQVTEERQAWHGQEVTFRPSSERHAIHDPSVVHHVVMTAQQSQRHVHHDARTGHVHNAVADNHLNDIGLSPHFAHGVLLAISCWRIVSVRRCRRRPVDTLANRMSHAGGVSMVVSGSPDFVARTTRSTVRGVEVPNRQRTSYFGNHEKTPVGRGGSDAAVVVQNARRWDSSDWPCGNSDNSRKSFSPSGRDFFHTAGRGFEPKRSRNWRWNGTSQSLVPTARRR